MIVLGLAGRPRAGKDTVAAYLVECYGFVRFSFADALRSEVVKAFDLPDESIFLDSETKDTPSELLTLRCCKDDAFAACVYRLVRGCMAPNEALVPRQVLQWFGTEYRRAQNQDYWLDAAFGRINSLLDCYPYPELKPQHLVFTDARFLNEQAFIHDEFGGNLWHVHSDRPGLPPMNSHTSNVPLPVLDGERELWNNADLGQLYRGVDLLLSTSAKFVKCEPMLPMIEPKEELT